MYTLKKLWGKAWIPHILAFALFLLLTEPACYFPSLAPAVANPGLGSSVVLTGNWAFW